MMTPADLRAIWRNLDLSRPDEWDTYDTHDHCYEAAWTYDFHGVTIVVDGCASREPWLGPDDISAAELIDASGYTYDLTPLVRG